MAPGEGAAAAAKADLMTPSKHEDMVLDNGKTDTAPGK